MPTTTIDDLKRRSLSTLGYTGSVDDMYRKYLQSISGSSLSSINDLEKLVLGGSGNYADRWRTHLNLHGITQKSLDDSLYTYWNSVGASGLTIPYLFRNSEVGVWSDPSNFSTLFQDSAGTTPVTAVGQTVGLILDKSQGQVLGSNQASATYATQAGFDNVTTSLSATSFTQVGATTLCRSYINLTTVIGNWYKITFKLQSATSGNIQLFAKDSANGGGTTLATGLSTSAGTTSTLLFRATTTSCSCLWVSTIAGATTVVSEIYIGTLNGNHATQVTSTARPTIQQDANGKYYLKFDGVDDFMVTPSIDFSATDKISVFAGVRKLSDAAIGTVVELSSDINANNGAFNLFAPSAAAGAGFRFQSKGTVISNVYSLNNHAAPITKTVSGILNISGDSAKILVNGVQEAETVTDQGTGNYGNYPLYIGMRAGTTLPFNGHLYSPIVRGVTSSSSQITATETYVNSRTGAY